MPYERRMAPSLEDEPIDDPLSAVGSEPLVPILRADAHVDPVALTTWHQALSNTLSVEVPHDLIRRGVCGDHFSTSAPQIPEQKRTASTLTGGRLLSRPRAVKGVETAVFMPS
jgi:hypothetical protein